MGEEVIRLLQEHHNNMLEISPPESVHALELDGLRRPDISFWSAWFDSELAGCGALKELKPGHGEIKSMRTANTHLRKGVAAGLLGHIIKEAKRRNYARLSLETGTQAPFIPAHKLYRRFGFVECAPFGEYQEDENSMFMTLAL